MVWLLDFLNNEIVLGSVKFTLLNIIFALVILIIGIILGKVVKRILIKSAEKASLRREIKASFIELLFTVIQWSIYILFINFALKKLEIPEITNWLTSILVTIPALVGSIILIVIGFTIAAYLRSLIEESKIIHYKVLSLIIFYFVIYVFVIFALRTALISIEKNVIDMITIALTVIVFAAVSYWHVKH